MRIVSWNIRAGGGRRVEGIEAQLQEWVPDIVALSEFRGTPPSQWLAESLADAGLAHQISTTSAKRPTVNSLLVASRWPVRRLRVRDSPKEPGRWLLLEVLMPTPFALGAMHVPNRVSGRKLPFLDAVLDLARRWRRGPALFVGDTNTGRIDVDEESPAFDKKEDGWMAAMEEARWNDAFRYIHGDERAYTWYSPNKGNGFRLDEAFVHHSMVERLREARYHWGKDASIGSRRDSLSDHAALVLDLTDTPTTKS